MAFSHDLRGDRMLTRTRNQNKLEAEQTESSQMSQKLALETESVRQESRQEDPKVGMGMDVHGC